MRDGAHRGGELKGLSGRAFRWVARLLSEAAAARTRGVTQT
jgi:hypothetical protein